MTSAPAARHHNDATTLPVSSTTSPASAASPFAQGAEQQSHGRQQQQQQQQQQLHKQQLQHHHPHAGHNLRYHPQHAANPPPPPIAGEGYYLFVRPYPSSPRHVHPARPQSALVHPSGTSSGPYDPRFHRDPAAAAAIPRRPSETRSLPLTLGHTLNATPPSPRKAHSGNASLTEEEVVGGGAVQNLDLQSPAKPSPAAKPSSRTDELPDLEALGVVHSPQPLHQSPSPPRVLSTYSLPDDGDDDGDDDNTDKPVMTVQQTVRSLLHLGLCAAPLSLGILIYTLLAVLFALITSPLRYCINSRPSLDLQIAELLLPPLNLQRRCIYLAPLSSSPSRSSSSSRTPLSSNEAFQSHGSTADTSLPASGGTLFATHLFAPFIALPLTVGAWVMAAAWGLGAVVSDAQAGDDRDERRLAQRLVGWWSQWLNPGDDRDERAHKLETKDGERGRGRRSRHEMSMNHGAHDGSLFA